MPLPLSLIESLNNIKGFNKETFEQVHAQQEQITSIRFNPSKKPAVKESWMNAALLNVPWSSEGYYLAERPSFTFDPQFHAGLYYVQEASSMFLEQALRQHVDLSKPLNVLDLCAAPGGKSTLLQSLITRDSLLVSNEVIKSRVNIVEENLIKWGAANTVVTNNDPKDFQKLTDFFDVMVVDAPCSGSGLFRKDPAAIKEWSIQNVELCCQRQQRILADVLPALKQDGVLIYSTCSYSKKENEDILDWLITDQQMQSCRLDTTDHTAIIETTSAKEGYGYRFYPDKIKGEGFFITILKKTTSDGTFYSRSNKFEKVNAQEETLVNNWIKDPVHWQYIKFKNEILALPASWKEEQLSVLSIMYIKKAGVKIGQLMNGSLIPDHQLALSNIIKETVPFIELNEADAVRYLKKETIQADVIEKGWLLVRYNGLALGWAKSLPNRINNYYPKEWRILSRGGPGL